MKISLLSTPVLALTVPSVFGVPVVLYRNGGADKPYNQVRIPQDYNNPVNGIVPTDPKDSDSEVIQMLKAKSVLICTSTSYISFDIPNCECYLNMCIEFWKLVALIS